MTTLRMKDNGTQTGAMRATLRITKALADAQRVRILMLLQQGERCVCQIVEVLGLASSTISKHLSILEDADLIVGRKDGRWAYYRLSSGNAGAFSRPVRAWLAKKLADDPTVKEDKKKLGRVTACRPDVLRKRQRGGLAR